MPRCLLSRCRTRRHRRLRRIRRLGRLRRIRCLCRFPRLPRLPRIHRLPRLPLLITSSSSSYPSLVAFLRQPSTHVTRYSSSTTMQSHPHPYFFPRKRPASAISNVRTLADPAESACATDMSSDEEREDGWLPARQSMTGTRMFLPELGSGHGRGLIHETWTTEQLLCCLNKWAKLLRTADSDADMKEGIHYEFTDWQPTNILYQRGRRHPICGMRIDDALSTRATKVLLHVGEVSTSFGNGSTDIEYGTVKRPRLT